MSDLAVMVDALLAETRRSTEVLSEKLNALSSSIQGRVNHTVYAGTVVVPASGCAAFDWPVPYGSVQIIGPAVSVTVSNAGPEASAPTGGTGVCVVPDASRLIVPIPIIGRQLSLYAPAQTQLFVVVTS